MLKKLISGIMAVLICMSLSGCGDSPPSDSVMETATEQTTVTTPTDLTEEEMEIWESMPEVVTMRVLVNFVDETVEVMYIEKSGIMKKILYDEIDESFNEIDIKINLKWAEDKFKCVSEAEVCGAVDLKKFIEYYEILLVIDSSSPITPRFELASEIEPRDQYGIYALRNSVDANTEIMLISEGYTADENIHNDPNGDEAYTRYIEFDPFREAYFSFY